MKGRSPGASPARTKLNEDNGFSRSLRRKAPSVFDAPALTGSEGLRVQAVSLAHPVEESPPERLAPRTTEPDGFHRNRPALFILIPFSLRRIKPSCSML